MSLNSARTRRLDRVLDNLWYIISAPQVTAALFVLLALMLGLAAVLPQLPTGLDDAEIDRWLATAAGRFPRTGSFLRSIDAFNLLASAWTRALMTILALNLLLRIAAQIRFIRHLRRSSAIPLPPAHVVVRRGVLTGSLEGAVARLRAVLEPDYTVTVEGNAAHAEIFAQRWRAGALGPLVTYIGLLLLLFGIMLDGAIGWRAADIALAPGSTTTLNRPGALQIALHDVANDGVTAAANLTLTYASVSRNVRPSLAQPARWGNLWLSQRATGPALTVTAVDTTRRAQLLQSLGADGEVAPSLSLLFRQTQSEQGFAIPTRNLTFRAVSYAALPEQGADGPVFLLEVYRGEEAAPAATELVEDEGSLTLDDITLTLLRDRYVVLETAYLPGLIPMLLGGLLALAAIAATAYRGMARVWAHLASDGKQLLIIAGVAGPAAPQEEIERLLYAAREPAISPEVAHAA